MADLKISQLNSIVTVVPATDVLPVVQGATTLKITPNQILGSGGVATLASATITGAATVGTTLGVTGASNLSGVVTVSAAATTPLDLTNAAVTTERQIKITNSSVTAYLGVEPAAGGRFLGSAASNAYFGTNGAFGLEFATSNNVRMTLNTTGNLAFKDGLGIDFSATANSSGTMTSELLNDYEEGTWTGTLKGSVSDPTIAVTATGKYTKVGRQVTVSIYYNSVSTVGASGNVTIDGLPFTGSESFAGSSITFGLFATSTTLASWNVSTSIAFYITGNFVQATHSPGTGKYLTTTITYFV
jgi:hypothetical protein